MQTAGVRLTPAGHRPARPKELEGQPSSLVRKDPERFNTKAAGGRTEEEIPKTDLLPLFFSLDRTVVNDITVNGAVTALLKAESCLGPLLVCDVAEQACLQWKARRVLLLLEGNC